MRDATPRTTLLAKRLLETPTTARTGGTTYENRVHLAAEFMSQITLTGCGAAGQGGIEAAAALEKLQKAAEGLVARLGMIGSPVAPAMPARPICGPGRLLSAE